MVKNRFKILDFLKIHIYYYFYTLEAYNCKKEFKGGSTRWFCWENLFWVSDYIGHYEPFANFWRIFFDPGSILKFWGPTPKPLPKNFEFLFHYLAQCVIHGWKALVLRIPEHFLFFLCDVFWLSYGQKRKAKNVENLPKSPF